MTPQQLLQEFEVRLGFLHPDLQFVLVENDALSFVFTLDALLGTTRRTLWKADYLDLLHDDLSSAPELPVNWEMATKFVVRLVADHQKVLGELDES